MAGTFSQMYIQIVFAVKGRENLIDKTWKCDLYKYIAGIIKVKIKSQSSSMACPIIYIFLLA